MSGGSYDYLCFADADNIFTRTSSLVQMAERLDDLCPEAAAETRALFAGPGSLYAELEARLARLTDLWHDVEWRDSNDYGDDQLAKAIETFRAQGPAPDTLVDDLARTQEIARLTMDATQLLAQAERVAMRTWRLPPVTPEVPR